MAGSCKAADNVLVENVVEREKNVPVERRLDTNAGDAECDQLTMPPPPEKKDLDLRWMIDQVRWLWQIDV